MRIREADLIRVSIGTAVVLGLASAPLAVAPTTAYLMLGGRCTMSCGFCAQAKGSQASESALSRVTWPEFSLEEVCARLAVAERRGSLSRCCIQVTSGRHYYRMALDAVRRIRRSTTLPLDTAILPANIGQVEELIVSGVDHVGFGLDAACERVFTQVKGPHWERMLSAIEETSERFPGQSAVHLIIGLGETEREAIARVLWARDLRVEVGLFAFTPIPGTRLGGRPQPSLGQYRRMQVARWLILHCDARMSDFAFTSHDQLDAIRLSDWTQLIEDGDAFRTSGCPDCNRPFYNERPGGTMYNYPRPLKSEEAQRSIGETDIASH